jgi:hypothetical protein
VCEHICVGGLRCTAAILNKGVIRSMRADHWLVTKWRADGFITSRMEQYELREGEATN